MNSPTQVSGSPLPRILAIPSESVFGGEGLGVRGVQRSWRFLIIANLLILGMLTCNTTLGQEPADNLDAKKSSLAFLKPLINVELSIVKRVCEPTDEQMTTIIAAAKDAHQAMANLITDQPQGFDPFGTNQELFMGPDGQWMSANPFKRVREDVARLLKPLVSVEQFAKYSEEAQAREDFEGKVAVGMLLNLLDEKLSLSKDQQEVLREKMMTEKMLPDMHTLKTFSINVQYMPHLPDHQIIPILTDPQKKIWSTLQRSNVYQGLPQGNEYGFKEDWLN
jgi:hypothetical protein